MAAPKPLELEKKNTSETYVRNGVQVNVRVETLVEALQDSQDEVTETPKQETAAFVLKKIECFKRTASKRRRLPLIATRPRVIVRRHVVSTLSYSSNVPIPVLRRQSSPTFSIPPPGTCTR